MTTVRFTDGSRATIRTTSGQIVWGGVPQPPASHRQQISDRAHTCTGAQHTATADRLSATYRTPHRALVGGRDVQLVYNHVGYLTAAIRPMPNPMTLAASIEVDGVIHPLTFDGADRVVLQGGEHKVTDPLAIELNAGQDIHVRTHVSVSAAGMQWGLSSYDALSPDEGGGIEWGQDLTRGGTITPVGTPSWSTRAYWPQAILAEVDEPTRVLVPMGSSSTAGWADTYRYDVQNTGGFGVRAAEILGVPYTHAANGGDAYYKRNSERNAIQYPPAILAGATHAFGNFGANDFTQTRPLLGFQREAIRFWRWLADQGVPYWQCTLTPYSSSTDGWVTVENQTPHAQDARRTGFNDWVRDGAPLTGTEPDPAGVRIGHPDHPLGGYIEAADIAESSRNSGVWTVDPVHGAVGTDGQHFHGWMHDRIAQEVARVLAGGTIQP